MTDRVRPSPRHLFGVVLLLAGGCSSVDGADADASLTPNGSPGLVSLAPSSAPTSTALTSTALTSTALTSTVDSAVVPGNGVRTGAGVLVDESFASLAGLTVGVIANQTAQVDGVHLIDLLATADDVTLAAIFAPEHGLRGTADAGETLGDGIDTVTGIPVFSLYGEHRQPTPEQLAGLDALVYDLQDVGARFYTYISTMGLAMQAAASAGIPFVVLDRPDPQGGTRTTGFVCSVNLGGFTSAYPIPSAYGLTAGELAEAIVGEGWLAGLEDLDLRIVGLRGWRRGTPWQETGLTWVPPSPGLPHVDAALAYPGTVLLEATSLSYGSGTAWPFSSVGAPWLDATSLASTMNDRALPGVRFEAMLVTPDRAIAPRARFPGQSIAAVRFEITDPTIFQSVTTAVYLLDAIADQADAGGHVLITRPHTFDVLAGSERLRIALESRTPPEEIVAEWAVELAEFEAVRLRYLRYR